MQTYNTGKIIEGRHELLLVWKGYNQRVMGRVVNNGEKTIVYIEDKPSISNNENISIEKLSEEMLDKRILSFSNIDESIYHLSRKHTAEYLLDKYNITVKNLSESTPPTQPVSAQEIDGWEDDPRTLAVYEGAGMWEQEYKDCRDILLQLIGLKNEKDTYGKTDHYNELQPLLWEKAKEFVKVYQHQSI